MLNIDGSDFSQKGQHSVGVSRQHCGIMGKTENSQTGVFFGYSAIKGCGLLDRRLYMSEKWFDAGYAVLRQECAVSQELNSQTQNELASAMMKDTIAKTGEIPGQKCYAGRPGIKEIMQSMTI